MDSQNWWYVVWKHQHRLETKSVISKQWLETGNIIQSHNLCKKSSFIFPITNDCFETTLFPIWCCRYVTVSKLHFLLETNLRVSDVLMVFPIDFPCFQSISMFPIDIVSNACFQCMFPTHKIGWLLGTYHIKTSYDLISILFILKYSRFLTFVHSGLFRIQISDFIFY